MKGYSAFVLLLFVGLSSCGEDRNWSIADVTGSYGLVPNEKPFMEELLSSGATSGWNYEDPSIAKLVLNSDSSFQIIPTSGGFECPSYYGSWNLVNDTIYLTNYLQCACPDCSYPDNEIVFFDYKDTILIRSQNELETLSLIDIERGRILQRK